MKLFVDIPGYQSTAELFSNNQRPDLVLTIGNKTFIIELTICFETNLLKSNEYKKNRYKFLKESICNKETTVELIFVELSSLGFYTDEIDRFNRLTKELHLNTKHVLEKCSETSIRCSYYIYNRRLKDWTVPELLLFG